MPTSRKALGVAGHVATLRARMWSLVAAALLAACGGGGANPAGPDSNQVNCPSNWGTGTFFRTATPAQIAACVESGENLRSGNPDGDTPLHLAGAFSDDPAVIRALINAGARPGARNNGDHTVLCVAVAINENEAVIQALLDGDQPFPSSAARLMTPTDSFRESHPCISQHNTMRIPQSRKCFWRPART